MAEIGNMDDVRFRRREHARDDDVIRARTGVGSGFGQRQLAKFNTATAVGGTTTLAGLAFARPSFDLRWAMQHAAA